MHDKTFNGADPLAFDHDGDKRPGGSRPRASAARIPVLDLETGVISVLDGKAEATIDDIRFRRAGAQDLQVAGRPDLLPLIGR